MVVTSVLEAAITTLISREGTWHRHHGICHLSHIRHCPRPLTAFWGHSGGGAQQKHHPSRDPQSQSSQKTAQYLYLPQHMKNWMWAEDLKKNTKKLSVFADPGPTWLPKTETLKTLCLFGLVPAPESGHATHLLVLKQPLAKKAVTLGTNCCNILAGQFCTTSNSFSWDMLHNISAISLPDWSLPMFSVNISSSKMTCSDAGKRFFLSMLCKALDHSNLVTPFQMRKSTNWRPLYFFLIFTIFHVLIKRRSNIKQVLRRRRRSTWRRVWRRLRTGCTPGGVTNQPP